MYVCPPNRLAAKQRSSQVQVTGHSTAQQRAAQHNAAERSTAQAAAAGWVWAVRGVVGELVGRFIRVRGLAITFS